MAKRIKAPKTAEDVVADINEMIYDYLNQSVRVDPKLEANRAKVIGLIVDEDEARRKVVALRLEKRLVDFLIYLKRGTDTFDPVMVKVLYEDPRGRFRIEHGELMPLDMAKDLAHDYIQNVLEYEDNDPIGQLAYAQPEDLAELEAPAT